MFTKDKNKSQVGSRIIEELTLAEDCKVVLSNFPDNVMIEIELKRIHMLQVAISFPRNLCMNNASGKSIDFRKTKRFQ